jgi:hypothetical protein
MEVLTGPAVDCPWTSVATFTSAKTKDQQTFSAAPDTPTLGGFVQVLVHNTVSTRMVTQPVLFEKCRWRARRGAPRHESAPGGSAGGPQAPSTVLWRASM